jgi:hypothetical protein
LTTEILFGKPTTVRRLTLFIMAAIAAIAGSRETANCSYIERWDDKLNHIRCAREKSRYAVLRHVNVSAGPYAGGHYTAPKGRLEFEG